MIRKLGLIQGTEWPWAVSLNDLRVISEILDHPTLFLHYLVRRLEVNRIESLSSSDELDFFGHFLTRGLYFRGDEKVKSRDHVVLDGFTEELDGYYRALECGEEAPKPRYPLPPRVADLITALEATWPVHFSTACLQILAYGESGLKKMAEQMIDSENARQARKVRMAGMGSGDDPNAALLLFCCVPLDSASELQMADRARERKQKAGVARCTLIVWQTPISYGRIRVHIF